MLVNYDSIDTLYSFGYNYTDSGQIERLNIVGRHVKQGEIANYILSILKSYYFLVALNIHAVFSCIRIRSETKEAVDSSSASCAIFKTLREVFMTCS